MKNRIGIVGGGQLGKMLALEAKRMGFYVTVIDPTPQSPAGQVVDRQIVAPYNDEKAIRELAKNSDYITFEIELANAQILSELTKKGVKINPSAKTLDLIKDKLQQKEFLKKSKIPVADFTAVETREDIEKAGQKYGYPILLKARFDAYDGRGNALINKEADIDRGMEKLKKRKLYVEKFVPFVKEIAVMVARSIKGEIKTYPVVETVHKNNICHTVFAPAPIKKLLQTRASNLAKKVMKHLKGAGVFGVEMFLDKKGKVTVNELAPRVHNSGHYTIEGCITSQFEQHIRAITGLPLGSTEMVAPASVMVNILGDRQGAADMKGLAKALKLANVAIHVYGKIDTKIERKMGHITVIDKNLKLAYQKAQLARKYISI